MCAERIVSDTGEAGPKGDVRQAASRERTGSEAGEAVGDRDIGEPVAVQERLGSEVGNAVGDRDAGQAEAITKPLQNLGDAKQNSIFGF
jgi:hypothetical protein